MAPVLIAIMMLLIVHTPYKRMCGYQIAIVLANSCSVFCPVMRSYGSYLERNGGWLRVGYAE